MDTEYTVNDSGAYGDIVSHDLFTRELGQGPNFLGRELSELTRFSCSSYVWHFLSFLAEKRLFSSVFRHFFRFLDAIWGY